MMRLLPMLCFVSLRKIWPQSDFSTMDNLLHSALYFAGTCKKIDKLAKKKTCAAAGAWAKSVSNHLYWVAASTPDGDGDVMLAKWLSVANHIQDVHHHASDLFPRCVHGELNVPGRKKKWLQPSKWF